MTDYVDPATAVILAIQELSRFDEDDWLEGTTVEQGTRLGALNALQTVVHNLTATLEQNLADSMDTDTVPLPFGRLVRSERTTSTWKTKDSGTILREDLTRTVADNIALDVATGDLDPMKRNVARATMRLALEAIPSFSTLNKAGRERLGLVLSDYREYATTYKVTVEALPEDEA